MYTRPIYQTFKKRISEKRKFIQVLFGPRQTGKTHRPKVIVYPGRLVLHVFFKPCSDVSLKLIQQTLPVWLASITFRISLIFDVLLHRVSADAQFLGNLSLGQPLPLQHQYVQNGLLFFTAPPRSH